MNPYRHILMHVDSSAQVLNRLSVCRALAARFGAEVTALYAVTPWLLLYPVAMDAGGGVAAQLSEWDGDRLKTTHERILEAVGGDPAIRWAQLDDQSPFEFANEALYADLLVLGRRPQDGSANDDVPSDFVSHVILHSGKPVLVLPPDQEDFPASKVVLVGWNGTRESASALTAAMPFLQEAKDVHVVSGQGGGTVDNGGPDALDHFLRLHDIHASFHSPQAAGSDAGQLLLDQARILGADLLVMGCYGHSRAREWILGGTTRTVLANATLPVLMAH
jgi:nucleotide-binding universal stress UspA family protein